MSKSCQRDWTGANQQKEDRAQSESPLLPSSCQLSCQVRTMHTFHGVDLSQYFRIMFPFSPEVSVVSSAFAPVVSKRKRYERNVIFILSSKTLSMTTQTSLLFLPKCFNVLLHSVLAWDKVMSFQSQQIITFQSKQNCITAKTTFVLSSSLTKTRILCQGHISTCILLPQINNLKRLSYW